MHADTSPQYTCCLCLSEIVKAGEPACQACRDVFTLPDDRHAGQAEQAPPQRVQVGPTDI